MTATGRFTLAREPKPWISEPQGVSIRYWKGRPLGLLLATVHSRTTDGDPDSSHEYRDIPIGPAAEFVAPVTGTVYFRVNDSWSELADNEGTLTVTVTRPNGPHD